MAGKPKSWSPQNFVLDKCEHPPSAKQHPPDPDCSRYQAGVDKAPEAGSMGTFLLPEQMLDCGYTDTQTYAVVINTSQQERQLSNETLAEVHRHEDRAALLVSSCLAVCMCCLVPSIQHGIVFPRRTSRQPRSLPHAEPYKAHYQLHQQPCFKCSDHADPACR